MKNIAIFASGSGSNAENIARYFENNTQLKIKLICCNKATAFVIQRAAKLGIECLVFDRAAFYENTAVLEALEAANIDWVILAGFLWKVPETLIAKYEGRIVNIHPALLPDYGGKGMYGDKVHEAVINAKESESGISIHYVNEHYDEGGVVFQAKCAIAVGETPESLAKKVHALEYKFFPLVLDSLFRT